MTTFNTKSFVCVQLKKSHIWVNYSLKYWKDDLLRDDVDLMFALDADARQLLGCVYIDERVMNRTERSESVCHCCSVFISDTMRRRQSDPGGLNRLARRPPVSRSPARVPLERWRREASARCWDDSETNLEGFVIRRDWGQPGAGVRGRGTPLGSVRRW